MSTDMLTIPVEFIRISHENPRQSFDVDALNELAESIKAHGILEPLIVRTVEGGYELIAGERRLRAAQQLELNDVPCVVRDVDDRTAREIRLLENLQRQDLTPLEEASAIKELLADGGTQQELAKKLGKSQTWISQRLKLLALPEQALVLVVSGDITPKHALVLVPLADYPEIIAGVVANLSETIDNGNTVTVDGMNEIIGDSLDEMEWDPTDDPDNTEGGLTMQFEPFNFYRIRHLTGHLDLEACKKCLKTSKVVRYGDEHCYCLDLDCMKAKLAEAKAKFEGFQLQQAKELGVQGKVDPNQLRIDGIANFKHMFGREFPECKGCDKRKDDGNHGELCLDPDCFTRHEKEEKAAALREAKDAWSKILIALDKATLPKQGGTLTAPTAAQKRAMLKDMGRNWETRDAVDRATKAFNCNRGNAHEVLQDDDLDCVLVRVLIMQHVCNKARYGGKISASWVEEAIKLATNPEETTEAEKKKEAEEDAQEYVNDVPDCYGDGESCSEECAVDCEYYEDCKAETEGGDE